ncbi:MULTISPECIES: Gfo/Idh/MocA family protein [Pseudoalteromonas]|uniref:Oxidoreductase n=1 Tax=Pseudoalteromonas amylolytica TaxID=1859457 RepID=A0A1S1MXX3_9GAMM|nr:MULTISPECIES: Gfo/Idh/MocA family oxidoreductase [Pseudoalteromonas]OHU89156.1 oxidoreductase [Pseudoalteromonas sp. JW3]OHU92056.1 oxidoreductase [Pseudoalteromonas amylolytica]
MKNRIIRWGVIGCGSVTEVKSLPAYQQVEGFDVFSVMRRDHQLAIDYAQRHNVPHVHKDAEELINDQNIDAVYIATPPDSHLYYALKVAQAGKICCIEKPLSPSYQESLEICQAFEERDLPLFTAYYRRSLPLFNKVKEYIDQGAIGDVRHVSWNYSRPVYDVDLSDTYNWRTDKNIAPGGYFDDLASHGLDIFGYLLGGYKEAKGVGSNQQALYSALDSVSACWVHQSGATGSAMWNFGSFTRQDNVVIFGSKGEIHFSIFQDPEVTLITPNGTEKTVHEYPKHIQIHHVENIKSDLLGELEHPSTGLTALHTSWVMDKILNTI